MEFEGIVYKILPVQRGTSARGEWSKQEVIFEMPSEFSRKICVTFFGDRAADAAKLREGDKVQVSINIESREYNGRWYTNASAWRITKAAPEQPAPQPIPDLPPLDGAAEPAPGTAEVDDLPF